MFVCRPFRRRPWGGTGGHATRGTRAIAMRLASPACLHAGAPHVLASIDDPRSAIPPGGPDPPRHGESGAVESATLWLEQRIRQSRRICEKRGAATMNGLSQAKGPQAVATGRADSATRPAIGCPLAAIQRPPDGAKNKDLCKKLSRLPRKIRTYGDDLRSSIRFLPFRRVPRSTTISWGVAAGRVVRA
jgi:hypothetical protein